MKILRYPERSEWADMVKRPHLDVSTLNETVASVLADVRQRGDEAVKGYELKFDHVDLPTLEVTREESDEAETLVGEELKEAIRLAHHNIKTFHEAQRFRSLLAEERGHREGGPLYPWRHSSTLLHSAHARHTRTNSRVRRDSAVYPT